MVPIPNLNIAARANDAIWLAEL